MAYIKIALDKNKCFCCAYCAGLMDELSMMGKSLMVTMVARFFTYLGYLVIMTGGSVTF